MTDAMMLDRRALLALPAALAIPQDAFAEPGPLSGAEENTHHDLLALATIRA